MLGWLAANPPAPGAFTALATVPDAGCSIWSGGVCDPEPGLSTIAEYLRRDAERN
jgi:hypothetical protein